MGTTLGGLYQWGGVPVASASGSSVFGNTWFVDNSLSASGNGKRPDKAYTTIAAAVAVASEGDTIIVRGTGTDYDESVTLATDSVTIKAATTHRMMCGWTADTDTTCLTITGDGCTVDGFLFRPDGATTGCAINISETGVTESGMNTTIQNNMFKSTGTTCAYAILANGCPSFVHVLNNTFTWVGYGIKNESASIKAARGWEIKGNWFTDKCTNGIYLTCNRCLVAGNHFSTMTTALNVAGYAAIGSFNEVHGNFFTGTYSETGGYYASASNDDDWSGNWNMGVTYGVTQALPA